MEKIDFKLMTKAAKANYDKKLAKKFSKAIRQRGMSDAEVAEAMGTDLKWVTRFKNASVNFSGKSIVRLNQFVGGGDRDPVNPESAEKDRSAKPTSTRRFKFDKKTGTITEFKSEKIKDVIIPAEIEGVEVKAIGYSAFYRMGLTSVVIPEGVANIGDYAFCDNGLTSVVIPGSVTHIGDCAFAANHLVSVVISESVTRIGSGAFAGNHLTSVVIPGGVTHIGDDAFRGNKLTSMVIPDGVAYVGNGAFCHSQLTSVTIPESVTHIGECAFCDNGLTSVVIPGQAEVHPKAFDKKVEIIRSEKPTTTDPFDPPAIFSSVYCDQRAIYRDYVNKAGSIDAQKRVWLDKMAQAAGLTDRGLCVILYGKPDYRRSYLVLCKMAEVLGIAPDKWVKKGEITAIPLSVVQDLFKRSTMYGIIKGAGLGSSCVHRIRDMLDKGESFHMRQPSIKKLFDFILSSTGIDNISDSPKTSLNPEHRLETKGKKPDVGSIGSSYRSEDYALIRENTEEHEFEKELLERIINLEKNLKNFCNETVDEASKDAQVITLSFQEIEERLDAMERTLFKIGENAAKENVELKERLEKLESESKGWLGRLLGK